MEDKEINQHENDQVCLFRLIFWCFKHTYIYIVAIGNS